ncbi:MAG: DNA cytosine methyltransferase, partial [Desulfobacterales bacterium]|nr:DNA cytosine methyltransferase [Desulfobacterales bacterium]
MTRKPELESCLTDKTVAEFFAGIGLMRLGLEREGWTVSFANDISPDKREMYQANFGESNSHFLLDDIHRLEPEQVPTVTLATASFPCNDLSLAGMRQGLGGVHSSAFWGFVRVLDKMGERRPPVVLLENVAGFLSSHGGRDFQAALLALNGLGYAVDAIIIDASRFVPQSRVRLFVIGAMQKGHAWNIQDSLRFYESEVRPKPLAEYIFLHPEITWNIRSLSTLPKKPPPLSSVLENLPDDSSFWWNDDRRDYLVAQMSEKHAEQLLRMTNQKKWSYGTVFRRIRK